MQFKLIYISPNGTTEKTTQVLKTIIEKDGHAVERINLGSGENREDFGSILKTINAADIVGFGTPAYHMDMLEPMKRFLQALQSTGRVDQLRSFLYLNYGGITSGKAFSNTAQALEPMGIPVIGAMKVVAPHFHHPDPFPTKTTEAFIGEFYQALQAKDFAPLLKDRQKELLAVRKKTINWLYPLVHIIGKKRELPITINADHCKRCGKCLKEWPVGAISLEDSVTIKRDKCLHCYHCFVACKLDAVEVPVEKLDVLVDFYERILSE
jgi:ferredoxin/multimeric flavodoxin WrbA